MPIQHLRLLIAAGNYDVLDGMKQALNGQFNPEFAYSHRDALHSLKAIKPDAILIDAAMRDRTTGVRTFEVLSRLEDCPPLIVYAPNGVATQSEFAQIVNSLDRQAIRQSLAGVFGLPGDFGGGQPRDTQPIVENTLWRSEEIETFIALSRSLTEVLDLSEVLNRVVEAARSLTNAEEGMILLPDGETGQLILRAKVGIDVDVARNFRVKTKDTVAGTVFSTGEPVLIGARGPQKVKTEYFVNALLYVPILLKGKPIGVLGVNNKVRHDVFVDRDQELLLNLAAFAAIAIENARIHGQSVKRARELKALVDASQAINASLELQYTHMTICDQMIRVLNVQHAELYGRSESPDRLFLLAFRANALWRSQNRAHPVISMAAYPALEHLVMQGKPGSLTLDGASPEDREWLEDLGVQGAMVIPIVVDDIPIAAFLAYCIDVHGHTPGTEMALRTQAAVLEMLALLDDPQAGAAVLRMMEEQRVLLGADWCELAVCNGPSTLHIRSRVGGGVWSGEPYRQIRLENYPDLVNALNELSVINVHEEVDMQTGSALLMTRAGARSLLGLPVPNRHLAPGLMVFADTDHIQLFAGREIDLARAVMSQASTALDNARLVHDLEASLYELKETQARLIQAARLSAMGELAAAVAHQVNNPLTTIVLDTELLLDNPSIDGDTRNALLAISRAGKRAAGVVRRLLATVRPQTSVEPVFVDVRYTIEETVSLVRAHIDREKRVSMRLFLPSYTMPPVQAAPGELDDVWLNLLLNAHDALVGRDDAEMGIRAAYEAEADEIVVNVWDNGPGIPESIVNDIFKPFFTTKPLGEGTGLGLHICKQIVDRIGGHIEVQSSSEQGTMFTVRLPVARR